MSYINSIEDLQESQRKRKIARDLYYLKPLLLGIKGNEDIYSFKELRHKMEHQKYNEGPTLILSTKEVYKKISVLALMKFFNRFTTYKVEPLENLVDKWFNSVSSEAKQELINADVLILYGRKVYSRGIGVLKRVLPDVINTRRSYHKHTWIFVEDTSENCDLLEAELEDYTKHTYKYY